MIHVGDYINTDGPGGAAHVLCDAPDLRPHIDRPWFRAYAARRVGAPFPAPTGILRRAASVPDAALARHSLLVGSTGSGKTRLLTHLLLQQLAAGCSAVVLDPKGETVDRLLDHAVAAGLSPESVILLDPRRPEHGVCGWNPLTAGIPLARAVGDLVALLEQSTTSWGPRLQDLLTNALLMVGAHEAPSLYEMAQLLVQDDYRQRLLQAPVPTSDPRTYAVVRSYFRDEFGAWSPTERRNAIGPVLNKVREMLRSEYLFPLLCARRNTLDLARLWRQPSLLLVRLDRTALGDEGVRLLAGLLTHALYRTALRCPGRVPQIADSRTLVDREAKRGWW